MLNLLPILPLDGGQITNQVLNITYPARCPADRAVDFAGRGDGDGRQRIDTRPPDWFRILLFGSLAYGSYQMLATLGGRFRR